MVKSQLHTNSLKTSAPPFLNVAWHSMAGPGTESQTTWLMPTVMYSSTLAGTPCTVTQEHQEGLMKNRRLTSCLSISVNLLCAKGGGPSLMPSSIHTNAPNAHTVHVFAHAW